MKLYSAIICDQVQELDHGEFNYINVFNEIDHVGDYVFDLALSYYGETIKFQEMIRLYAPDGQVLLEEDNEVVRESDVPLHSSITTMDLNFDHVGRYRLEVRINGNIESVIPIFVNGTVDS